MSTAPIEIIPIDPVSDRRFFDLTRYLYRGSPAYVPTLDYELREQLNPKKSPLFAHASLQAFLALRNGDPVGRITAQIDRDHLSRHQDATGHFGFFEAVDDQVVVNGLIEAASNWLSDRGMRRMVGPFSMTINHVIGVLVDGFETPSYMKTPYNPAHYEPRLLAAGLSSIKDVVAHEFDTGVDHLSARISRMDAKEPRGTPVVIRPIDWRRFPAEMDLMIDIYNDAWWDNWNSVPIGAEEGGYIAKLMRPVMRRSSIGIAMAGDTAIGAIAQMPDLNQAFGRTDGRLFPDGWAKLLWGLFVNRPTRSRIPLIGVRRAWHHKGEGAIAAAKLLKYAIDSARGEGYGKIEISWMLEDNHAILNLVSKMPSTLTKRWRIYQRPL